MAVDRYGARLADRSLEPGRPAGGEAGHIDIDYGLTSAWLDHDIAEEVAALTDV